MSLLTAGSWTGWSLRVSSNSNHSMYYSMNTENAEGMMNQNQMIHGSLAAEGMSCPGHQHNRAGLVKHLFVSSHGIPGWLGI